MAKLQNSYALLIGVGNDLPVTVRDATEVHDILIDEEYAGYDPDHTILLTEENATRKDILNALDTLINKTDEESSVFLFYSGHGGYFEPWNQFYLVPYNFDPVAYEESWVKAEELRNKIGQLKSKRLVFFLDCCHAAGIGQSLHQRERNNAVQRLVAAEGLAQEIDDGRGMSIISSCREDQQSFIMDGDSNSLYTKCLKEVLKATHKDQFEEPYIRISEVVQYIFKKVPERNPHQKPYANLQIYDDFILSCVPQNQGNQIVESNSDKQNQKIDNELVTVFRETETANSVLLFVHGFSGESASSFGRIPDLLRQTNKMDGWDMFPLGFSEYVTPDKGKEVWASVEDIERIADYLATSIKFKYSRYSRVAIVAYSLGGLVAQRAITNIDQSDRTRISHLILFGCPNNGLEPELVDKVWNQKNMDLGSKEPFITSLRKDWSEAFNSGYSFELKVVAATQDDFIPIRSNFGPFEKKHCFTIGGNHLNMVNVNDEKNDAFHLISNSLNNNNFFNKYTSKEEINIALGKYNQVIKKLLPNVEDLDIRGFKQLIFALEGSGKYENAMQLLNEHQFGEKNGDLLGLLGGRLKRKYLENFSAKSAQEAIQCYEKGLQLAIDKDNIPQIYYHAINLAFLNLVSLDDDYEMKRYAEIAQETAIKDPRNTLWKYATLGEANLYLNELEIAKENYQKASEMAGIREKISIHTNAYKAYTCLMLTDDQEDEFIKFLKDSLLS